MIKLEISNDNYYKMVNYARQAYKLFGTEISGFAPVYIGDDNEAVMHEPVLVKQECTAATTELDKKALAEYINGYVVNTPGAKELVKNNQLMFCWWHSHHTMKAFWSGTDDATIEEFAENGSIFAIVVNNKAEHEAIYAERSINRFGMSTIEKTNVELVFTGMVEHQLEDEIKKYVTNKKVSHLVTGNYQFSENYPLFHQNNNPITDDGLPYGFEDEIYSQETLYDIEEMNKEASEIQKEVDKPKVKRIKKIDSTYKKLRNDEYETVEHHLTDLEAVINTHIEHFHINKISEEDALFQVSQAVKEYNQQSTDVKLHNPSTLEDITYIDDIIVDTQELGEDNVTINSEISKHIPVTRSLL